MKNGATQRLGVDLLVKATAHDHLAPFRSYRYSAGGLWRRRGEQRRWRRGHYSTHSNSDAGPDSCSAIGLLGKHLDEFDPSDLKRPSSGFYDAVADYD